MAGTNFCFARCTTLLCSNKVKNTEKTKVIGLKHLTVSMIMRSKSIVTVMTFQSSRIHSKLLREEKKNLYLLMTTEILVGVIFPRQLILMTSSVQSYTQQKMYTTRFLLLMRSTLLKVCLSEEAKTSASAILLSRKKDVRSTVDLAYRKLLEERMETTRALKREAIFPIWTKRLGSSKRLLIYLHLTIVIMMAKVHAGQEKTAAQ